MKHLYNNVANVVGNNITLLISKTALFGISSTLIEN